jgi:phospholipase A1
MGKCRHPPAIELANIKEKAIMIIINKVVCLLLLTFSLAIFTSAAATQNKIANETESSPVEERAEEEEEVAENNFAITFYKPTYILPYYYTASPYNRVYLEDNRTPDGEKINSSEVKYQLSFKVPLWKNIFHHSSTLYLAYTQLSYWQLYNDDAFFRETDYEPELFLANEVNFHLFKDWSLNFLNVGVVHQSNGYGGDLERSWNRLYVEAVASKENWMVSFKPWYIVQDSSLEQHNSNIGEYLGYGRVLVAYKYSDQVFSLQAYNVIESGAQRPSTQLTWSIPLTSYLRGYVQVFSGYGQSLIEYDHRSNSFGIGIAFSDWI